MTAPVATGPHCDRNQPTVGWLDQLRRDSQRASFPLPIVDNLGLGSGVVLLLAAGYMAVQAFAGALVHRRPRHRPSQSHGTRSPPEGLSDRTGPNPSLPRSPALFP